MKIKEAPLTIWAFTVEINHKEFKNKWFPDPTDQSYHDGHCLPLLKVHFWAPSHNISWTHAAQGKHFPSSVLCQQPGLKAVTFNPVGPLALIKEQ